MSYRLIGPLEPLIFLTKPVEEALLVETVRGALDESERLIRF